MQRLAQRGWCCGFGLVAVALATMTGCKKPANEAPSEPPAALSATASAAPTPPAATSFEIPEVVQPTGAVRAPAATGSAAAPGATASAKPADHAAEAADVRNCCAALRKEATGANQATYDAAARSCDGIAGLVAKGATRKDAALTSIRAALRGGKLPAGCH